MPRAARPSAFGSRPRPDLGIIEFSAKIGPLHATAFAAPGTRPATWSVTRKARGCAGSKHAMLSVTQLRAGAPWCDARRLARLITGGLRQVARAAS
jgi:hypothetical protein